jgi:deoxyribose-phosphate aldolase
VKRLPSGGRLADLVEHTALRPETTPSDVERLCREAVEHGFAAVCLNPVHVTRAAAALAGTEVAVVTVVSFPLGAHATGQKVREAEEALAMGATELDMVADLGAMKDGRWEVLEREVAAVARAVDGAGLVKVILETAALEPPEILRAASVASAAGADFLKTSTGFHPAGGATAAAVALLRRAGGPGIGVKAAGGIRSCEDALRMVAAGATRIGTSRGLELAACEDPLPPPPEDDLGRPRG